MPFEAIIEEKMFCMVAPDGTPQPATIAPDFQTVVAYAKLLHSKGLGESVSKLIFKGFKIVPVIITIQSAE